MPQNKLSGKSKLVGSVGATAAVALLALVQPWEGKRNDPYKDIVGKWTVCYGETRVKMRHYTDAQCEDMLDDHLADYGAEVLKRNANLRTHPYQLAAAASLEYNIGAAKYYKSLTARRFSLGDYRGGCDAMLQWRFAGGKPSPGLLNRRRAEVRVCLQGL